MHYTLYVNRKENRLKQSELAELIGIHSVTFSNKENGKAEFELSEAFKLAAHFGITVDELFKEMKEKVSN